LSKAPPFRRKEQGREILNTPIAVSYKIRLKGCAVPILPIEFTQNIIS